MTIDQRMDARNADQLTRRIVAVVMHARDGHFGVLSTGEQLAAALALNRADWLKEMSYTYLQAVERIGPDWAKRLPEVAELLEL